MESSQDLGFDHKPDLPIAISSVGGRYLLFDIKIISWLRREHKICGTTIGTLPLAPSQNLFLGVPVEIMPEEAQLLVERGVAVIVDDARAHDQTIQSTDKARRVDYLARLERQAKQVKQVKDQEKEESRKVGLQKRRARKGRVAAPGASREDRTADLLDFEDGDGDASTTAETFVDQDESPIKLLPHTTLSNTYQVTPATSRLLLPTPPSTASPIKDLPASYPLYRHLHDRGFFMTPGLRFGCQYTVYPGDPLRFHSHFLAVGTQWDEEIDLMDIVGGGRLGTGVKKGFLLGGANPAGDVRTFSVEWAAM